MYMFFAVAGSVPDPFLTYPPSRYRPTTARTQDTTRELRYSCLPRNWSAVCTQPGSSWTCIPEYSSRDERRRNV